MAGGDSAARGMAAATLLGAHGGSAALPAEWVTGMAAYGEIREILEQWP